MLSVTVRIPVDVIEAMKTIAPQRGLTGYQTLLKSYVKEGLRRDEAQLAVTHDRLIEALKRHGVTPEVIEQAAQEARTA
ncbi:MAG: BrnA antitoxin family protein [Zoogloeaceae bacterium]|jgi:hypothetical protein|nr:BrnA antitoxin family protein [Zoogloeaceae bacterium]